MQTRHRLRASLAPVLLVAALLLGACGGGTAVDPDADPLSRGEALFTNNCAACHGPGAQGTAAGPPLVHEFYAPDSLPDEAIHTAVAEGVAAGNWDFGPMPAVRGVDREAVGDVIVYVRHLQREAGIG